MSQQRDERALRDLGQKAAAELEPVNELRLRAQQQRLLQSLEQKKPRARLSWQVGLATALTGAAALSLVWAFWPSPPATIECFDSAGPALSEGSWVTTEPRQTRALRFSEGSELALASDTKAQLARLGARRVRMRLARGTLRARIHSAKRTRWTFVAGPYRTIVAGTHFSIQWQVERRRFEVDVTKGSVKVAGGSLGPEGKTLQAGQRLVAQGGKASIEDRKTRRKAAAPRADAAVVRDARKAVDRGPASHPTRTIHPPAALDMRWKPLAKRGDHRGAMRAARKAGWRRLTRRLGPSELLLLADTARLVRDVERAREALLAARKRFGRQHAGRIAAYRLGRLLAELGGDPKAAARWFGVFRQEAPKSALVSDALARQMLAAQKAGDRRTAGRLARLYLARYPKGAYAAAAKGVISAN